MSNVEQIEHAVALHDPLPLPAQPLEDCSQIFQGDDFAVPHALAAILKAGPNLPPSWARFTRYQDFPQVQSACASFACHASFPGIPNFKTCRGKRTSRDADGIGKLVIPYRIGATAG